MIEVKPLRLCEVCGTKEDLEEEYEQEAVQSAVTLHICESCREDRKVIH